MDTNSTQDPGERLQDDARFVAESLPALLAVADRFRARAAEQVSYHDLSDQVASLLFGVEVFAGDLLKAFDPLLVAGLAEFEASSHPGWQALARYSTLKHLMQHPEVLQVAVERAHAALWHAITDDDPASDAG
ncbi:MAG TPA: hypothetical protein VLA19_14750 [Herpetosiphonaceae bacterium]|nr:hypothetical protein [Herpetosiphonaceae bacterium]